MPNPAEHATRSAFQLNARLQSMNCIRCRKAFALTDKIVDQLLGCPQCLSTGYPAALRCHYADEGQFHIDETGQRLARYRQMLPFLIFPTLGEGATALICRDDLSSQLGVRSVWLKYEGLNPTGSHKDRMSPFIAARAASLGFTTLVAASSGNAGVSLSAYAAVAGLSACIAATNEVSDAFYTAMLATGATVERMDEDARWPFVRRMVEEKGYYPATNYLEPPVSSNPFGVDGYKTVAYELFEELQSPVSESLPTKILIPTCRGDVLAGIAYGFEELCRAGLLALAPHLVAVEPARRLELVLSGSDYRQSFATESHGMHSIGGDTATFQSKNALTASQGSAVTVSNANALKAQRDLAAGGMHVELSSAAALAGARDMQARGQLSPDDVLVLLITASGAREEHVP